MYLLNIRIVCISVACSFYFCSCLFLRQFVQCFFTYFLSCAYPFGLMNICVVCHVLFVQTNTHITWLAQPIFSHGTRCENMHFCTFVYLIHMHYTYQATYMKKKIIAVFHLCTRLYTRTFLRTYL